MKVLRRIVSRLINGVISGMHGGFVAGIIFGVSLTIYSYIDSGELPKSLVDVIFPYLSGSLGVGLAGGCLMGGIVALTLPLTRPYLLRISQIVGGIAAIFPSLLFLRPGNSLGSSIIVGTALIAGIVGGTVAFKAYTNLFE